MTINEVEKKIGAEWKDGQNRHYSINGTIDDNYSKDDAHVRCTFTLYDGAESDDKKRRKNFEGTLDD